MPSSGSSKRHEPEEREIEPETLPRALGRLRVSLDDAFVRASRSVGLTSQQAELLCAAFAPSSIKRLADELRCDRSNITRLVDRASSLGHVKRRGEQEDGRVTLVELTPRGEKVARRFVAELEAQTALLRANWPLGRETVVVEAMNEVAYYLDAGQARPPRRKRSVPTAHRTRSRFPRSSA